MIVLRPCWFRTRLRPWITVVFLLAIGGFGTADDEAMRDAVRADWAAQEAGIGRAVDSPDAIRAAIDRTRQLLSDLSATAGLADLSAEAVEFEDLVAQTDNIKSLGAAGRTELYYRIRDLCRLTALRNPLVTGRPILFMQRRREVGYMLYEYLGWYYAHGHDPRSGAKSREFPTPEPGGGVYVLEEPGRSMRTRCLTEGRLPLGHYVTLALAYDAQTAYFAFADPTGQEPYSLPGYAQDVLEPGTKTNTFHLFALDLPTRQVRQLTDGPHDDFDPCPLPDGGIAFESTRRGSKLRCGGGSPEVVHTLHRMDANGDNVRTLSFHETHEWHPSVLQDGRIVYTRWDYVDRNAAKFHGLWTCQPDGSNPSILFGNYTTRPWACYQAKAIPGSSKILFVAGGHHANVGGRLMILDPARLSLDRTTGEDRAESLHCLTPDVCFAEAEGWPSSYFHSPWPLSDKYFLAAFSHDPLPGGYTGTYRESETGLYYIDCFGNRELLFRRAGISAVYPIPLAPRPAPPVSAGTARGDGAAEGQLLLADVRESLLPLPAERPITRLRVFQLLPKSRTDNAGDPCIGHPDQANARMLLGTVPVERDGSAHFRAPAEKPLYFQAVDAAGRAVQGMRSVVYLQRGERRGCVGCHEPPGATARARVNLAALRPASIIEPGPDGSHPFGYARLIQPILDRHCISCHDGSTGKDKSALVLTGEPDGAFTRSYANLRPFLRWPSPDTVTRPGELGADQSPLSAVLAGAAHRKFVELPDEELRTIYLWLDAHVPFFGTYEEEGLQAQRRGLAIDPPALQ
ncbi:MAG: hypothetical protein FJ276_14865 [Planctomycetes bacterium]|nr:hypothetical protein [Planctomycetota bacterium]